MAWIPMYLLAKDVSFLNDWLNQEKKLLFWVFNGLKKWIAKREHNIVNDIGTQVYSSHGFEYVMPNYVEYYLWHIPSGQLPLLEANNGSVKLRFQMEDWNEDGKIDEPWSSWKEIRSGTNSRIPYLGAGHPGVIHMGINLPNDPEIRMSNFGGIGNHYRIIGNAAEQTTDKFWRKLRKMAKKVGTQIPRCNAADGKKEVFAFSAAYEKIKIGRPCSSN